MEEKTYKHIIKIQSQERMIKTLKRIDRIYYDNMKFIVEDAHYYFEDKQSNIVTFNSEKEIVQELRRHKGVKKLYNKLLSDEKSIINDCIKLAGDLDNAIRIYVDYITDNDTDYNDDRIILMEVIGSQLFPMAYIEYCMITTDDYDVDINKFVSYNENGKVNGIFALDYDVDTIINLLTTKNNKYNSSNNIEVGSKEWLDALKNIVREAIKWNKSW